MSMFLFFYVCVCLIGRMCSGWLYVTFCSVPVSTLTYNLLLSPAYQVTLVLCYSCNVYKVLHDSSCKFLVMMTLKCLKENWMQTLATFLWLLKHVLNFLWGSMSMSSPVSCSGYKAKCLFGWLQDQSLMVHFIHTTVCLCLPYVYIKQLSLSYCFDQLSSPLSINPYFLGMLLTSPLKQLKRNRYCFSFPVSCPPNKQPERFCFSLVPLS